MKILIIEPHADDALLSCYDVLFSDDNEVHIMTLTEESEKSSLPLKANNVVAEVYSIKGLDHTLFKTRITTPKYVKDLYKLNKELMIGKIINDIINLDCNRYELIKGYLNENYDLINSFDAIYVPVGLIHPDHLIARVLFDDLGINSDKVIYYEDKPYVKRVYGKMMLEMLTLGMKSTQSTGTSMTDKEVNFKKYYPTEKLLLRFDSDEILSECRYWRVI